MRFKKFLKYLLFLWLMVSVAFLYSFSSARNKQKKVHEIDIKIEAGTSHFLNHEMVNKLLIQKNETVKNQAKSTLNLYGLENYVSKNPYVEKASVFLTIKGKLKTVVKQRTPIVRVVDKNGSYYVDKQGVKVPLSDHFSARVMLVYGVEKEEEMEELMPLISVILEDNFLQKEIVGIEKFEDGEVQFSVRSGEYKIDFGDLAEIDTKFKKLKAFYNNTFKNKTIQNYKTINVKYHNQVVCTKVNQDGKQ